MSSKLCEYITDNLLVHGYDTWVKEPQIEQILMLKELCDREIENYFENIRCSN